jgi:hypothetical protein
MLIVNAPTFFSATWRVIKGWLDPRTASKIEVVSSRSTMEKRLKEYIDPEQIPSDYGGTGPDSNKTMMLDITGDFDRMTTKMLYLRGHGSETVTVEAGETLEVSVFTRSTSGAKFTLTDAKGAKSHYVNNVEVRHSGTGLDDNEKPTAVVINKERPIKGPVKLKVKADSHAGRFSTHNFLLVFSFKSAN